MNEPANTSRVPWLLIIGMLVGGGLLVLMSWESMSGKSDPGSANVVEFTSANWQAEVIDSDVPVLVDFTAKWCGPCKMFAPTVNKLAELYQGKVKVGKFDVGNQSFDKAEKIQATYPFQSIPRVMIFKGGRPIFASETPADLSETRLVKAIQSAL